MLFSNLTQKQKIITAIVITIGLVLVIGIIIIITKDCKPNCNGAFCGPDSDDGCGGTCECKEGGKCMKSSSGKHICCYPNCDGLSCGDDGCGGTCSCNSLPNGVCQDKKCCYKQDCNNVYCGDDGCGGTCECQTGTKCSKSGVCANSGESGWTYNVLNTNVQIVEGQPISGIRRTNDVNSPLECAGWLPENVAPNKTSFPCKENSDCPYGDECRDGFCNRNDVFQYWIYDEQDPSGFKCTKLRQGAAVCGVKKEGASAFDIISNVGPSTSQCSNSCSVGAICPSTGKGSCCPQNWTQNKVNSSECADSGDVKCCLNNPDFNDYQECIKNYPSCENVKNVWWKSNKANISNGICNMDIKGPSIGLNQQTLQNKAFTDACEQKYPGDICTYNDGNTSFSGVCKSCLDNKNRCFPENMCVSNYDSSSQPGMCSSKNICA